MLKRQRLIAKVVASIAGWQNEQLLFSKKYHDYMWACVSDFT